MRLRSPIAASARDAVGLPRFGVQVSGLRLGECACSDELLLVVDQAEVIDR
jgi:hypothetical protein